MLRFLFLLDWTYLFADGTFYVKINPLTNRGITVFLTPAKKKVTMFALAEKKVTMFRISKYTN